MTDARVREQVLDVLGRFAHGLDGRDWALYRSVFTAEVDIDYSSYRPGSVGRMPADAWVDRARQLFPGLDASQHVLSNAWLQSAADVRAAVRSTVQADHFLNGARYTLGGYYVHRLQRDGDDWSITGVTLTMTWQDGDRALLAAAAARVPAL